jgi:hypothetical protein
MFLEIVLRILRLEVSVYNVYITNQFQITFAQAGKMGKIHIRGDCEYQGGKFFQNFVPITSKNSASVHSKVHTQGQHMDLVVA